MEPLRTGRVRAPLPGRRRRGGGGGTIQLAAPERAAPARPLLLLPPSPVPLDRLQRLAGRLSGAELLQPDSGRLLRVAQYADSGPLVTTVGYCRAGRLSPLPLPAPPPAGWRDVRVVNKTYRVAYLDWLYPDPEPMYSLISIARDVAALLKEAMSFHSTEIYVRKNHLKELLELFQNGSVDVAAEYLGWTHERNITMRFSLGLGLYDYGMLIGAPERRSSPSFGGSLESARLRALAVGLLLLAAAGGYLALRPSGAAVSRLSAVCLLVLGSFCARGEPLRPGRLSQCVAAAVVLGVGMLSFQFYAADLLSQVTMEQARLPFAQLDDITRRPDWNWAVLKKSTTEDMLRSRPRPGMDFTNAIKQCNTNVDRRDWIPKAVTEKFAFFAVVPLMIRDCTLTGCPSVCMHPPAVMRTWGAIPLRRGLTEWRAWNAAILRLMETGLLARLRDRRLPERLLRSVQRCDLEARPRYQWSPLGLSECWPVLAVLLAGAGAALLLLLLEMLARRLEIWSRQPQLLGSGWECSLLGCAGGWAAGLGACYRLSGSPLTWPAAEEACHQQRGGAHLSSVLSDAELRLLSAMTVSAGLAEVHIGLVHRPELTSRPDGWRFRWADGRPMKFTAWANNEPSGDRNNTKYGSLRAQGAKWVVNVNRHVENRFICKYYP
ncbi:Regenerating islet-derived protein 3-beta [Amphibalanus amphitrite]|uniref:Regenerating islet-derived protein 3-beta n=1 Tax=Amphibalanus amphitrite TaxID=1232801 RepID=A0A6A4X0D8_AMPAM|nr:Regenerating islet-derived protein 3-beta [Amphibalanus amphitrite]